MNVHNNCGMHLPLSSRDHRLPADAVEMLNTSTSTTENQLRLPASAYITQVSTISETNGLVCGSMA